MSHLKTKSRVEDFCELMAGHADVTLPVTKEALRRLYAAGPPDGDDCVRETYGSEVVPPDGGGLPGQAA